MKNIRTKIAEKAALRKCRLDAKNLEEGQGAAEYAVVAGLILVVAVSGAIAFSGALDGLFQSASQNLDQATNAAANHSHDDNDG